MTHPDACIYPVAERDVDHIGLSYREYFAGLSMQGLLAGDSDLIATDGNMRYASSKAVAAADALIAALNAEVPNE